MTKKDNNLSRRKFLKAAGVAGVGSVIAPMTGLANASEKHPTVPTRSFGTKIRQKKVGSQLTPINY